MTAETKINELPISLEELQKKKENFQKLNIDIWRVIEITPEIWEILWNYKEELILTRKIEIIWENLFKVEFAFPVYNMVTGELPNEHVSIIQMQLAIIQWLFMAFGFAIKQKGANSPMSYETFLLNRGEALYRRDEKTMRKKLKFNEKAYLIFKVQPFIKKWNNYCITAEMLKSKETFLDGKVECVMQDQYLFDEEKKSCKDIRYNNDNTQVQTMVWNVRTRFEANQNLQDTMSMTDMQENPEEQK